MLPDNVPSTATIPAPFKSPDLLVNSWLLDWDRGGIELQDGLQGLNVRDWKAWYQDGGIYVGYEGGTPTLLLTKANVEMVSLAFDQAMRPNIAYQQSGVVHLWWFDTLLGQQVEQTFVGASYPRLCLDDHRDSQLQSSDVIFAYLRSGNLYYRQQRDRYQIERLILADAPGRLRNIGMSDVGRLQFELS